MYFKKDGYLNINKDLCQSLNCIFHCPQMPQTVPRSGCSPPSASQGERAVPTSPADLQHLLRLLGAASPPEPMLHSPQNPHTKPPPPYPEDNHFLDRLYDFEGYPTPSPSSDEGSIPTVALQPPSPYNSLHYTTPVYIKEEPNRLSLPATSPYPLSPSGSCISYSSHTQYSSPVPQHEEYLDIEALLKENQILQDSIKQSYITPKIEVEESRDHNLLRSALEDRTFQERLNLRPFPLELGSVKMEESSGGDETLVAPDIDKVLSMAIEQSKRDVDNTCTVLGISPGKLRISFFNQIFVTNSFLSAVFFSGYFFTSDTSFLRDYYLDLHQQLYSFQEVSHLLGITKYPWTVRGVQFITFD